MVCIGCSGDCSGTLKTSRAANNRIGLAYDVCLDSFLTTFIQKGEVPMIGTSFSSG